MITLNKSKTSQVTQQMLHERFVYIDGRLVWKKHPRLVGKIAGTNAVRGYRQISFGGTAYREHRIVFLYHHGYMPDYIDHINGNRSDNRIENLREATVHDNNRNTKLNIRNKSGVKGVFWDNSTNKWCARVWANGKFVVTKYVDDIELAELIAIMGREKYHGAFANHGVQK